MIRTSVSKQGFKTKMQVHIYCIVLKNKFILNVTRFFEDIELHKDTKDSKYRFKKDGRKHTLIIQEATLDDIGMYHAWTNGGHTKGELEVEGATATFSVYISCFQSMWISFHFIFMSI